MVTKKIATRDYLRGFITRANKEAGVNFNSSKLNSKEECEEYLLNLIKNLRHKKQDNKAYIKEIDSLKEELEILNTGNKRLERDMRIYQNFANDYSKNYFDERDKHERTYEKLIFLARITMGLGLIAIIEGISIAIMLWK